jgi:ABC-type multidrug transport system ATPase subunit
MNLLIELTNTQANMEKKSPASADTELCPDKKPFKGLGSRFWLQVRLLIWKQALVFSRNLKSTLFQFFTPILICIFLVLLQQLSNYAASLNTVLNPDTTSINSIPKCTGSDCITLGVAYTSPSRTNLTDYVLQYVSDYQDLKLGTDIKVIANNYTDLFDYLNAHPNKTQTAVLFCTGSFVPPPNPVYNGTIYCNTSILGYNFTIYSIVINTNLMPLIFFSGANTPQPIEYASLSVKAAIDNALVSYYTGANQTITINTQGFPSPTNRWMAGYDIVSQSGAFYFFIPPMVTFVVLLIEIVREKEYKLRHGLSMMGMSSGPYWLSWITTGTVFILLVTNSLILSGMSCLFDIFLHTPYLILLMLFGLYSISMMSLAFLMGTLLKTTRSAYTTSYAFILAGLVLQFLMSNVTLIYSVYGDDVETWVKVVRVFLSLYPPFNFSKAYGDIALKAGVHYSSNVQAWVPGTDYTWSDFTKTIYSGGSTIPSTALTMLMIVGNTFMIASIAWYLDHVVESNRGSPDPWYFFVTSKYWNCKKKKNKIWQSTYEKNSVKINGSINEASFIETTENPDPEKISLKGLGKIYRNYSCCKSSKDIHAVNDFSLEADNKELLAILGHNGAGKSTLISILTGLSSPSYGTGTICGFDILEEMDEIRKILGICPQHDILWSELTPREHLILFGRLKHLPYEQAAEEADEKLNKVKLSHVRDKLVGTFSGGMKRRLSVAISGVGDPRIIILDEPTTGMDPINRRSAWKLIKEMKQGRVLILTTHSMEEADVLSDKVCVIVDGYLKCIGTSLNLKNSYGDGYRITLVTKNPQEIKKILNRDFTSAKIIDSSAGSLVISMPFDRLDEIKNFFKAIEGVNGTTLKNIVDDWGLSNTTLEEVFMRVTGKKEKRLDEM